MSEAEVAKDILNVLAKVRQGAEIVVELNHQPVAVLKAVVPIHRKGSEILARMRKDSTATMDADFARDIQAAIDSHREPLDPRAWD